MNQITKYYDAQGNEVDSKDAVKATRLTLDAGKVVKTEYFLAKKSDKPEAGARTVAV